MKRGSRKIKEEKENKAHIYSKKMKLKEAHISQGWGSVRFRGLKDGQKIFKDNKISHWWWHEWRGIEDGDHSWTLEVGGAVIGVKILRICF